MSWPAPVARLARLFRAQKRDQGVHLVRGQALGIGMHQTACAQREMEKPELGPEIVGMLAGNSGYASRALALLAMAPAAGANPF